MEERDRQGIHGNHGNLFRINRPVWARDGAHIDTKKCAERPEAEEGVPHNKDEEELLVLRANALPDPYVTAQSISPTHQY